MYRLLLFIVVVALSAGGQVTIHVLHPWASDTVRVKTPVYLQCHESWYPGVAMKAEANNWYTYTITSASRTSNDRFEFSSYIPTENNQWRDRVTYSQQFVYSTIFKDQPAGVNEVWIVVSDVNLSPKYMFEAPVSTIVKYSAQCLSQSSLQINIHNKIKNGILTVTAFMPRSPALDVIGEPTSTVMIYDGLGTVVAKGELGMVKNQLNFAWDGTNLRGKCMGAGTYFGIVKIHDKARIVYRGQLKIELIR